MIMLKIVLVLFQIYVLMWKKGICKLLRQVAAKHTAIYEQELDQETKDGTLFLSCRDLHFYTLFAKI